MEIFVQKLMTLTSEYIEAVGTTTAREVRDQLVEDIFPDLSKGERDAFSDHTELEDIVRFMSANFGHILDEGAVKSAAEEMVKHLRHSEEFKRHEDGFLKRQP